MSRAGELLTRAMIRPALGNLKTSSKSGKNRAGAGTSAVTYMAEGQPLNVDWGAEDLARQAYLGTIYVMRCARLIAETCASLPWVAGPDPTDPADYLPAAPLANLLGPSTPQAPGGPNVDTSARVFWIWTLCQYLVSGRFGWQCALSSVPGQKNKEIVGLYPLVSAALAPKPVFDGVHWFDGYEYTTAMGGPMELTNDEVVYAWRPSMLDFRLPESVLQSAQVSVYIARNVDKYIANLLKNDLVATTLITTPPFAKAVDRRAWQEQFHAQFSGVNNVGKEVFMEVDPDEDDPAGYSPVKVDRLAQTVMEAGLTDAGAAAKNEICLAFGVPRSLIGDASQRTYANAASEYKNFWTLTMLDFIAEIQDHVNFRLADRVGDEVGWFDLSKVTALQPPSVFMPPAITDVISTGVANAAQIANVLGIPSADSTGDSDTYTVDVGEESSTPSPSGRSMDWHGKPDLEALEARAQRLNDLQVRAAQAAGYRAAEYAVRSPQFSRWLDEADRRRKAPVNVTTIREGRKPWKPMEREVINVPALVTRSESIDKAKALVQRTEDIRALITADRKAQKMHDKLAETYPEDTLGWVDEADWSGPTQTDLSDIEMDRRPGGRDQAKVAGIAKGIAAGNAGAIAPVVLVKTPDSEKLKIADGYHRTLAHKRLNHKAVPSYIAHVDEDTGPWDKEMHDKKLNRADEMLERRALDEFDVELEAMVDG